MCQMQCKCVYACMTSGAPRAADRNDAPKVSFLLRPTPLPCGMRCFGAYARLYAPGPGCDCCSAAGRIDDGIKATVGGG